jgi:BMFP domain-containing protein YqiC
MQTRNPILSDLAKLSQSVAGTVHNVSKELEQNFYQKLSRHMQEQTDDADHVFDNDIALLKEMLESIYQRQNALEDRIIALEKSTTPAETVKN